MACSPPYNIHWRSVVGQATLLWLATRIAYVVLTYIAVMFNTQGFDPVQMGLGGNYPPSYMVRSWSQWDTDWYLTIAAEGYEADPNRTAFFPLYPLLIHIFTLWSDETVRVAVALIISNLGALVAFIALGLLTAQEEGPSVVPYAIGALAAYPFSFFTGGRIS